TAGAKIDLPDHGACEHVLHGILNEDPTLMKHGDDPGDHADELHIVLDDDEAGADVDGRSSATVRSTSSVAMPAVGSSGRISFASGAIVMPISTHCRSP